TDGSRPPPPGAKVISAAGKYVIPGLMDANVHLVRSSPVLLVRYEGRYDELALEGAQLALKGGLTTVFDSWGPREYLMKARAAIQEHRAIGSRLYLAGNIVGLGGPMSDDFHAAAGSVLREMNFAAHTNSIWQEEVGPELITESPEEVRR